MHLSSFIHQKSYEKIVYQVRRNAITLLPAFFGFLLLLILPFLLYRVLGSAWPNMLMNPISFPILTLLTSTYYLSSGLFFYTYFTTFYLDVLIVTNDRLLWVKQQGLFARTISELDLYKIQDITSEVKGVFPSLFRYGNLTIETAGATNEFYIENVSNPERLRQAIMDLAEEDRKYHENSKGEENLVAVGL